MAGEDLDELDDEVESSGLEENAIEVEVTSFGLGVT